MSDHPSPPLRRYLWVKRYLKGVAMSLAVLAIMRGLWGAMAHRAWLQAVAELKSRGEPVTVEDLRGPPVSPENNAAVPLLQAAKALTISPTQDQLLNSKPFEFFELLEPDWAELIALSDNNQTVRALVRQARERTQVDWGVQLTSPLQNVVLLHLGTQRQLSKALGAMAVAEHHQGRDREALAVIRDLLHLAEQLEHPPTQISHLVALSVCDGALRVLKYGLPDLWMGPPPNVEPAEVRALIADLLAEDWLVEGLQRAVQSDRLLLLDLFEQFGSLHASLVGMTNRAPPGLAVRAIFLPFKPLSELDGVELIQHYTEVLRAREHELLPDARKRLLELETTHRQRVRAPRGRLQRTTFALTQPGALMANILLPSYRGAFTKHYEVLAQRRLAATALAIRLFHHDHARLPGTLDELVPEYLPAVPTDPMATTRQFIQYRPDQPLPILYSVGNNGVDDGGRREITQNGRIDPHADDVIFPVK